VIRFNHDLVIENEIFKRFRLRQRWRIRSYGTFSDGRTFLTTPRHPLFPSHEDALCDHSRPISAASNSPCPRDGMMNHPPYGKRGTEIESFAIAAVAGASADRIGAPGCHGRWASLTITLIFRWSA
jgi:hypothetical protein